MPELGKATYWLTLNTTEFDAGMSEAEVRSTQATNAIARNFGIAEGAMVETGAAAGTMATEVGAASGKVVASTEAVSAAQVRGKASTIGFGSAMHKTAGQAKMLAGFGGLLAMYEVIKGGIDTMRNNEKGMLLVGNAIDTTGRKAGVTREHAEALAEQWMKLTGASKSSTLELEQMGLRFTDIRNVAGGSGAIFDRYIESVQNLALVTGKGARQMGIALGKALQDPVKYLSVLGRAGVVFSQHQKDMVKALVNSGQKLQAQKLILDALDTKYKDAAASLRDSFTIQWHRAREELNESSATIVKALLPAFVSLFGAIAAVAGVIAHHTTLFKSILFIWLAWKGALIAASIAMRIYAASTAVATGTAFAFEGATVAETAAVVGFNLALAAGVLAAAALGVGLGLLLLKIPGIGKGFDWLGGKIAGALSWMGVGSSGKLEKNLSDKVLDQHPKLMKEIIGQYSKLRKQGKSDEEALAIINKRYPHIYHGHGIPETFKEWTRPSANSKGGGGAEAPGGKTPPLPARKEEKVEWAKLESDRIKAEISKSKPAIRAALLAEREFLQGIIHNGKRSAAEHLAALQNLQQVNDQLATMVTAKATVFQSKRWMILETILSMAVGKPAQAKALRAELTYLMAQRGRYKIGTQNRLDIESAIASIRGTLDSTRKSIQGLFKVPVKYRVQISKAQQTASLKDDLAAFVSERDYLTQLIAGMKKGTEKYAAAEAELTRILKKISDIRKKMNLSLQQQRQEVQAARVLRGTFFAEFAPSIFHRGSSGLEFGSVGSGSSPGPAAGGKGAGGPGAAAYATAVHKGRVHHFAHGGIVPPAASGAILHPPFGMDRHSAYHYSVLGSNGRSAPLKPDITPWLRQFMGRGLSRAAANGIARWWHENFAGIAKGYASGGWVTGNGTSDTVPAMLTPGELVLTRQDASALATMLGTGAASLPGNLGRHIEMHQHNTYHEIPRDKHKESRRMQRAVDGAMH